MAKNGYHLRCAEPRDVPTLEVRHAEQNARDKTNYPLPQIFDKKGTLMPNIALALVVVNANDEVLQGIVFERNAVEMCLYGCDPRATAVVREQFESIVYLLVQKQVEIINCIVPKKRDGGKMLKAIAKPLKKRQFKRSDTKFAHFYREL